MRNPWADLPNRPPYVLPQDAPVLERHRHRAGQLSLDLLPAPFMGRSDAAVVLLSLNPGGRTDYEAYGAGFVEECRKEMLFLSEVPFGALNPTHAATPGYRYWDARVRRLREEV